MAYSQPQRTHRPGENSTGSSNNSNTANDGGRNAHYFVDDDSDAASADASADFGSSGGHLAGGHFRSLQQHRTSPGQNNMVPPPPRVSSAQDSLVDGAGSILPHLSRMPAVKPAAAGRQPANASDSSSESIGLTPPQGNRGVADFARQQQQNLLHPNSNNSNNNGSGSPNQATPNTRTLQQRNALAALAADKGPAPMPVSTAAAAGGGEAIDDDVRSDAGSAHSSHQGTNSTGSGEGEDEDPLLMAIVDIVRKARKRAEHDALKGNKSSDQSPTGTPQQSALFLGAMADEAPRTALAQPLSGSPAGAGASSSSSPTFVGSPPTSSHKLLAYCKAQQMQMFGDLESKSSRALIIADPHVSNILFTNEAAQRLFGRLDLVGSKLETLMPEELAERHSAIINSYQDRYRQEYKKSGQATDSRLLDVVKPRRLTVMRQVNGRPDPIHIDGWVRSLRVQGEPLDEPARLMALEAVEAEQAHQDTDSARIFKAALSNVSDGMVIADYEGRIEWINGAMEKLCGYPLQALLAVRGTVNLFLPDTITPQQHEGFLQHFRNTRQAASASQTSESNAVVVSRNVTMRTALPPFKEEILLRVEVAYNKLVAFIKSTREFIPRDEFESERLKLLLPASVVKLLRGADASLDITSHFWEFENKSVFFTDVEGFSEWSRNRSAKQVHDRMQPMFSEFEQIIQGFGGELVHRVGDAVLAVFGLNGEERHHARYAVACAVELQQWSLANQFSIRIGVHSGTIGAGIYGSSKGRPGFDVWGPIVNAAKRLESTCTPGGVHLTKNVVQALGHKMAGPIHTIVIPHRIENCKGVPDQETFLLPVKASEGNTVGLPEKFVQMVNQQRAKFARWRISNEETERRLAELQKASRG